MPKALVPLANGVEEVEALTVVDVLRRGGVEVVTASIHNETAIRGAHGIDFKADKLFSEVAPLDFDAIVLPGGGEGTENLKNSDAVIKALQAMAEAKKLITAICAAPTVLTEAGVVPEGIHLTCYPSCVMDLDRPAERAPVVAEDNFITGQAPGAALLFALVVLQSLTDERTARKVARGMVTDVLNG